MKPGQFPTDGYACVVLPVPLSGADYLRSQGGPGSRDEDTTTESSLAGLDKWRSAIDQVESLGARHIVAGHQNSKLDDDAARTIADTREYLDVAEEALRTENTAVDYFNAMVERYPDRLGRTVLWATAQAVFGIREHPGEDPAQFIAGGWL
jgi:hypothetical protein